MTDTKEIFKSVQARIGLEVPAGFNPREYFVNRPKLYIWSSFKDRILPNTEAAKVASTPKVDSFELTVASTDEEIEAALPKEHVFTETAVCEVIAALIQKQPDGEEGALVNNGYANLFYTPAFVVSVRWRGVEWRISSWVRDDGGWDDDGRVFSPATDS